MSGLRDVRAGDEIVVRLTNYPVKRARVEGVGRVWLTADRHQYRIEDGGEKTGRGYAQTVEAHALGEAREAFVASAGILFDAARATKLLSREDYAALTVRIEALTREITERHAQDLTPPAAS